MNNDAYICITVSNKAYMLKALKAMKIFKTSKGAFNFIKRNLNTGIEKTINESIHFGVGEKVYAYGKDVHAAGYVFAKDITFTYIQTDAMLLSVIEYVMTLQNGLAIVQ